VLVLGCALGCSAPPLAWVDEPVPLAGRLGLGQALVLRGVPDHVVALAAPVPLPRGGLPALDAGACAPSLRWARSGAREIAVAWWVVRPDSSVVLRVARSTDDGVHWTPTASADTTDRGVRGCQRPGPALAFDAVHGETHLAYFLEPAAGAGVFYVRGVDAASVSRGASEGTPMFQPRVAIVFGESLAQAGVAGHGDTVVVAYQDPNGRVPEIDLALSTTGGRTFTDRFVASGTGVSGRIPR